MENIGRKLTDEGLENVKKLDTNGNGKLDVDEVGLEDSSDGQDFFFNVNGGSGIPIPYGYCFPYGWGK